MPAKKDLGPLMELTHGAKADKVWAIDKRTLRLVNFFYDGQGPGRIFLLKVFLYTFPSKFCCFKRVCLCGMHLF